MKPIRGSHSSQDLVFNPQESADLAIQLMTRNRTQETGGIRFGIDRLDEVMNPLRPGELVSVYGLPGHHKTGLMNHLSRKALETIEVGSNEIVVRATWEQSVEEDTLHWISGESGVSITRLVRGDLGEPEWKVVMDSSRKRAASPMWIIGHSQLRSEGSRTARPRMTMSDIARALEWICNSSAPNDIKIKLVVLDYLQRIRPDPQDGGDRREQVMEIVNRAKDCALSFGCTTLLGVQAKREVSDRDLKIPRQSDAQESSNVEQTSDKIISLWYPWKTEKANSTVKTLRIHPHLEPTEKAAKITQETWKVTENLLLVGIPKQKMGPIVEAVPVYVNPAKNQYANMFTGGP